MHGARNSTTLSEHGRRMLLAATMLGLLGCPGDDGGDDGNDSEPTTSAGTTAGSGSGGDTTGGSGPATTTTPVTGTDDGPVDSSGSEDSGSDTDDPTTGGMLECGNGMMDPGEACDDGNMTNADGCNTDCTVSGSILWSHTQAGGIGQSDLAWAVAVDEQGRAYVAAELHNGANVDFWVRQYTEDDGLGWTHVFDNGVGNDAARSIAYRGGVVYANGYRNTATGNDVWMRSFNTRGAAGLSISYNSPIGGNDVGQGVAVSSAGNIILAGNDSATEQSDNIWVRQYDAEGNEMWAAGYNGANSTDQARAVSVDPMGNVVAVGYETVSGAGRDIWIRYYNSGGTEQWTRRFGGEALLNDEAWGVGFDSAGNVVVAGYELLAELPWRTYLTKFDPLGETLWTETWEGEVGQGALTYGMAIDSADDIVVVGDQRRDGFNDIVVRKYDTNGVPRWSTTVEGAPGTNQTGRGVAIGPEDRIWVAGGLDQGIDARDIYVARLAP